MASSKSNSRPSSAGASAAKSPRRARSPPRRFKEDTSTPIQKLRKEKQYEPEKPQKRRPRSPSPDPEKSGSFCRRCCCSIPFLILLFVMLGLAGGIIIWQFLPDSTKGAAKTAVDVAKDRNYNNVPGLTTSDGPPAPTYIFNQCSAEDMQNSNCCNGVPGICDFRVSDVFFAALHNAQSSEDEGFLVAGNHEFKFEDAMVAGFRALNVDVGVCNGQIQMIHGKCSLGQRDPLEAFTNMNTFLEENPLEVLLIVFEIVDIDGVEVDLNDLYIIMQNSGITERLYWHTDPTKLWPPMRQLIEDDTRVLAFHYGGTKCSQNACPPAFNDWFYYAAETQFNFQTVESLQNTSFSCQITRGSGGYKDFFAINNFVTNILPSRTAASIVNQKSFELQQINACSEINALHTNLLWIDFWSRGDTIEVAQTINLALANNQTKVLTAAGNATRSLSLRGAFQNN